MSPVPRSAEPAGARAPNRVRSREPARSAAAPGRARAEPTQAGRHPAADHGMSGMPAAAASSSIRRCPECAGSGQKSTRDENAQRAHPRRRRGRRGRCASPATACPPTSRAPPGDLFVVIRAAADPRFERRGADLYRAETIDVVDAVLGASIDVPLLDGREQSVERSRRRAARHDPAPRREGIAEIRRRPARRPLRPASGSCAGAAHRAPTTIVRTAEGGRTARTGQHNPVRGKVGRKGDAR